MYAYHELKDTILSILGNSYDQTENEVLNQCYAALNCSNKDIKHINTAIKSLVEQAYIEKTNSVIKSREVLNLTDKAKDLLSAGGFTQLHKKQVLENILLDNHVYITTEQRKTDRRYRRTTIAIALGGLFSGVVVPLFLFYLNRQQAEEELQNALQKALSSKEYQSREITDTPMHPRKSLIVFLCP